MSAEEWRPILGFEGRYEVSNLGRVRSLDRDQTYKNGHRVHYKGKLLKANSNGAPKGGYLCVSLGGGADRLVHRLVAHAFIGPPPPDRPNVCHNDGNKHNNTATNLRYDDQPANAADRKQHGTDTVGTKPRCVQGHLLQGANLAPYRSV